MNFCGLDVGTSGVKAMVFDETGKLQAGAHYEYDVTFERDGARVLSPNELWTKTKFALATVAEKLGGDIDALSIDTFGEGFVMMGKDREFLHDIMIFTDSRGEEEYFRAIESSSAEEIAQICGLPLSPTYSLSKVLYLKERRPELYERAERILLIEDFIIYMLCNIAAVDYSAAARTMFFDIEKLDWSALLMDKFGLDRRLFSQPVRTGTVIGPITASMAGELGIKREMKIVAGGHDQTICAVGAGLRPGGFVNSIGTSACITPMFDGRLSAAFTLENGLSCEPAWGENQYCTLAYNPSCGVLINWFFKNFAAAETAAGGAPYELFEKNFPEEPTHIMVQPYIVGSGTPALDYRARLGFAGIGLGTTRFDLYRAVLEGLAMDQRRNVELLETQGIVADHFICVGGGSASAPWLQLLADVLRKPVSSLASPEAAALGSAITAAAALGAFPSLPSAASSMSRSRRSFLPIPANADSYDLIFPHFLSSSPSLSSSP
jgi:xylulokinase